jgi:hypothetical protein
MHFQREDVNYLAILFESRVVLQRYDAKMDYYIYEFENSYFRIEVGDNGLIFLLSDTWDHLVLSIRWQSFPNAGTFSQLTELSNPSNIAIVIGRYINGVFLTMSS